MSSKIKNAPYQFSLVLKKNGVVVNNPTLATGDVQRSLDGAAFSNLATLPVVTPAAGDFVQVDLSADEMNTTYTNLLFREVAGAEWDDEHITILTDPMQTTKGDVLQAKITSGKFVYEDVRRQDMKERLMIKGTDDAIKVQLLDSDGLAYPVTGATITAQLRDLNKTATANGAEVTCGSGETGAIFAAGTIVCPWTDTQTAALTVGRFQLEINIVLSGGDVKKAIPKTVILVKDQVI